MTIQNINIGNIANDGTGDDLREAFRKVNENFDELDLRSPESTTAAGIGTGVAVFAGKVGDQLTFKNFTAGTGMSVTAVAGNDIQISTDLQGMLVVTDGGSMNVDDGETLRIIGGAGITTNLVGNTLTITDTSSQGSEVFSTQLEFGDIVPNITSHAEYMQLAFDVDYGTITSSGLYSSDMGTL
jgi:hypothetical protein